MEPHGYRSVFLKQLRSLPSFTSLTKCTLYFIFPASIYDFQFLLRFSLFVYLAVFVVHHGVVRIVCNGEDMWRVVGLNAVPVLFRVL